MRTKSFKLINFKINSGHSIVPLNGLDLDLINEGENGKSPYFSIIIGKNGLGKSQILRAILDAFIAISASKEKGEFINEFECFFEMTYQIGGHTYHVSFSNDGLVCNRNLEECTIFELEMPPTLIACTYNLQDRFRVHTDKSIAQNDAYKYLGLRSASNNAFIGNNVRKVVESINTAVMSAKKFDGLGRIFELLDFAPKLKIEVSAGLNYPSSKTTISRHLQTVQNFKNFLDRKIQITYGYRQSKYRKIIADELKVSEILNFVDSNKDYFLNKTSKDFRFEIEIDFSNKSQLRSLRKISQAILDLKDAEIIKFGKLNFFKQGSEFSFAASSSGEHNIISSLFGIVANMQSNSMIVIDEPEISLHPNWQLKYVHILNDILKQYKYCHVIIATHSHFLLADVRPEYSNIIRLERNTDNQITSESISESTYGMSAEENMYRIFELRTFRNYYFEKELRELLHIMSHRENTEEAKARIAEIIVNLSKVVVDKNDPLNLILKEANEHLENL
jgi:hypothetical protein